MKKMLEREVYLCDFCGEEYYTPNCTGGCDKVICHDCRKAHSIEYNCGVYHQGSRDGIYCLECHGRISEGKGTQYETDKLKAYQRIKNLTYEYKGWVSEFEVKRKEAEFELERLCK